VLGESNWDFQDKKAGTVHAGFFFRADSLISWR
jgi:hypothetical protein